MNYENILINGLLVFIIYKVIIGSLESIKYFFIVLVAIKLYFKGLRTHGGFYRQFIQNENESDVYLIRPLKEYF